MLNNPTSGNLGGMQGGGQFIEGTPVYDLGGNKVGTVSEHGVEDNCLVVHHGLLREDVYVPLSAIQQNSDQGVMLNVDKNQFDNFSRNQPPANAGQGMGRDMNRMDQGLGAAGAMPMNATPATNAPQGAVDQLGNFGQNLKNKLEDTGNTPLRDGDIGIPVVEEQLVANKQQSEAGAGRVRVHKDVIEQPETISAPVTHEELRVEHNPVSDNVPVSDVTDQAFQGKDIDIPLMGEQLNVEKQARVVDELHLHKERVTENERMQDTVRRERVNIEGVDQPLNAQPLNDLNDQNQNTQP